MDSCTRKRSSTVTRLCFIEEDDGLASLVEMEAGFPRDNNKPLIYRPIYYSGFQRRSSSLRNLASIQGFPSSNIANGRFSHQHKQTHFLDSCFLCNKAIADMDIFMYRGDIPFCSEECRQEQIDMDEAIEKNWKSTKALRKKEQTTSTNKATLTYRFRTNTVAAA